MTPQTLIRFTRTALVALLFAAVPAALAAAGDALKGSKELPTFRAVQAAVEQALAAQGGYRPGDLISQTQVRAAVDSLARLDWKLADAPKLIERAPADEEFLTTTLRSTKGRAFMQSIARYPNGYDRLDRLTRMPQGQETVRKLVEGPGGYKLVEYLAKSSGGKELGVMLGRTVGEDFNRPTGRIYTARQLLAELQKLHTEAARKLRTP